MVLFPVAVSLRRVPVLKIVTAEPPWLRNQLWSFWMVKVPALLKTPAWPESMLPVPVQVPAPPEASVMMRLRHVLGLVPEIANVPDAPIDVVPAPSPWRPPDQVKALETDIDPVPDMIPPDWV